MKGDKASDTTLIIGGIAEKAIMGMQEAITDLLKDEMGEEKTHEIAKVITEGK